MLKQSAINFWLKSVLSMTLHFSNDGTDFKEIMVPSALTFQALGI
jgi:hypothetical protein